MYSSAGMALSLLNTTLCSTSQIRSTGAMTGQFLRGFVSALHMKQQLPLLVLRKMNPQLQHNRLLTPNK